MGTLIEAVKEGNLNLVESFLKTGTDSNECNRLGLSGLHLAAVHDNVQIMELLIENGGNVNKVTVWGSSSLHLAAHQGHLSVVTFLLKSKADVNIKDDNNDTPLHLACTEGHKAIIKELLLAGADRGLKNKAGNTALEEGLESEISSDIFDLLSSSVGQEKIFSMSSDCGKFPHLNEGCKPLLNQTEFIPEFEVPTNESYSSIINEFSLPASKYTIPSTAFNDKPNSGDMLKQYSGAKSMEKAQKFSFLKGNPMIMSNSFDDLTIEQSNCMKIVPRLSSDHSFTSSFGSLSNMLKFDHEKTTGSSIDSSVYPETYQLYKQLNPDSQVENIPSQFNCSFFDSSFSEHNLQSYSSNNKLDSIHSSEKSSIIGSGPSYKSMATSATTQFFTSSFTKLDSIISNMSPIFECASISTLTGVLSNIAKSIKSPWPTESKDDVADSKKDWIFGDDYVLVSNTPLNVQNFQDREGSCSLVFKILHQRYGPIVLKMMVNLLNESDHDTGQSGTVFLKKHFSAEHTIPISLSYHPNIVQMLHCYNSTTTPFKRFLPLLVPSGLDVEIDMASRTSFFAMPEYPFSLKNYVNKFIEQKVKLGLTNRNRMNDELHLIVLLLLQCLFVLKHLEKHNVVHRDIKLDNIMLRHSGQVILIDFGMSVQLYNQDGSPIIATDRNDIVAGNPVAWSPEISHHHHSFSGPVPFSSIYRKSDLFTLGKTFCSVLEVFGFIKRDSHGKMEISNDLTDVPYLYECVVLLDKMTNNSPDDRISVDNAILTLGKVLFFKDCTNHREILSNYIKISLHDIQNLASITDIENLTALTPLCIAVSKQFVSTVNVDNLISECVPAL